MFDYRYHAISLAAVLLALALGVLIGVAIGDSNLVSSAKSGIVDNLQSDLDSARAQQAKIAQEQQQESRALAGLYEISVRNQLAGRKIGLVFLGSASEEIDGLVREAVDQAGGQLATVITIREPLDLAGLSDAASGTPYSELQSEPALLERFGFRMGDQLVQGGQLLTHVQTKLLSSFDGQLGGLDGIVLVRADPQQLTGEQSNAVGEFQRGLMHGIAALGTQTVGAELSDTEPSQIPWYKRHDLASVDDLDRIAGRAALVFALGGAHGSWGNKPTADGVLPHLASTINQP